MSRIPMKNFKGPGSLFLWVLLFLAGLFLLAKITDFTRSTTHIIYSNFLKQVEQDKVKQVLIADAEVQGVLKDGTSRFETVVPTTDPYLLSRLREKDVDITIADPASGFSFFNLLLLLSFLGSIGFMWFMFRQSRGGGSSGSGGGGAGNLFNITKSKAKMFMPTQIKVNFDSVAGVAEAKEELKEVIDFLKNPEKYRRIGAKLTRGVLLVGEPGNGKTLLAKAVAGEANCPFFSISGSDFIEVFVGVGAARVRDLFIQARKHVPCIIFIDEIDAVGRHRGSGLGGGNDEREQTLNQLLTEMDGFDTAHTPVIVLAATNRPDVLDKALLRPGRFDRRVYVPYPDLVSREEILNVHAKGVKIDNSVDFKQVARGTPGFTGADLANLINEAALNASKFNKQVVSLEDFEEARDKVMLGKERKTIILSEREREVIAYHEAGHTLINLLFPQVTDALYKVSIIPRGMALGVTHSMPEREKYTRSKEEMLALIKILLGGRGAEELVFNSLETGVYSDFKAATQEARKMVCSFGMSSALGNVVYDQDGDYRYSEETARMIDQEVRTIIDSCRTAVINLLQANRDKLDVLAKALLEKETLFAAEIYQLLGIEPRVDHSLKIGTEMAADQK